MMGNLFKQSVGFIHNRFFTENDIECLLVSSRFDISCSMISWFISVGLRRLSPSEIHFWQRKTWVFQRNSLSLQVCFFTPVKFTKPAGYPPASGVWAWNSKLSMAGRIVEWLWDLVSRCFQLYSGKLMVGYGKSWALRGKSTISMGHVL